jgi:endonuclease/exonuclease/phosphatase family metal-dependent hydrolase
MANRKTKKRNNKNNKQRKQTNKYKNKNKITRARLTGNIQFKVTNAGMNALKKLNETSVQEAIKNKIINQENGIKLVIDPHYTDVSHSNFTKYITNEAIQEIENIFTSQKCVKEPSLYDQLKSVVHDGLKYKVLSKGTYLFKAMPGFITPEMENDYIKSQPDFKPMWFGQKYIAYGYARNNYLGVHVYEVTDDIHIIDIGETIGELITILEKHLSRSDIDYFKYTIGYDITAMEQLIKLVKEKAHKWNEIWFYTRPGYFIGSHYYCHSPRKQISPQAVSLRGYQIFFEIFKTLHKLNLIEGMVVEQVQSYLDNNGVFKHEEFILSTDTYRKKLKRNTQHQLDWTQWKIANLDLSSGFILSDSFSLQTAYDNSLVPNEDFKLIRFWKNNITKLPKLSRTDTNYLLSYNVHGFKNINMRISRDSNFDNILKLIRHFQNNVDVICLQEVVFESNDEQNKFTGKLKKWGYSTAFFTPNGLKSNMSYKSNAMKLAICFKTANKIKIIEHIDSSRRSRNSIVFKINKYIGCLVHLTIGEPNLLDFSEYKDENNRINNFNYYERTKQLNGILDYQPDFIIGDFNMTSDSKEAKYLLESGYEIASDNKGQSTPYNKVDMIFKKNDSDIKLDNYINLQCNYSDHRPFLIQLIN